MGLHGQQLSPMLYALFIFFVFLIPNFPSLNLDGDLKLDIVITKEIAALGFVTLSRPSVISISVLLVNNILFNLGGEEVIAVYAIISRLLMFSLFPVLGITQGFIPIAGYNYGANYKKSGKGY